MKRLSPSLLILAGALLSQPALAHHSFSMFDRTRTIVLKGTVKEFQWTNPHSWIEVLVKDNGGKEVEWGCAMGAPGELLRSGWKPRSLKPGDSVVVTINPMKNGDMVGSVVSVNRPDGTKIGA